MTFLHFQCLKDAADRRIEIESILAATGLPPSSLITIRPFDAPASSALIDQVQGLIVGGAGWSVFEEIPYYVEFTDCLRAARKLGVPILGICFGAQALAQLFCGKVVLDDARAEYGTIEVARETQTGFDPLFSETSPNFLAQSWHHDRISVLPPGTYPLAWSKGGEVLQAFGFPGELIWGLQFHPERTSEMFGRVLEHRRAPDEKNTIAAIRATLRPSPEATALLGRFVRLSEAR
jgi:GMP synthase-like glutamine amidotransferase